MRAGDASPRSLELKLGNMFEYESIVKTADIVLCDTQVPFHSQKQLLKLLRLMKTGSRLLTYENVAHIASRSGEEVPFVRLQTNGADDRYFTSWALRRGHRFHLFERT